MRKNKTDVDELDFRILSILLSEGNISNKDLSVKVNAHQNTVMQRVRKMQEAKVIRKYTVDIDYEKLGFLTSAIIFIKVKGGRVGDDAQLKILMDIPQIKQVYAVTGSSDLMVHILVTNQTELSEVLRRIQTTPIVGRTNSQLILYTYKNEGMYNPFVTTQE